MSRPRSVNTPRIRRTRDSMLSSTELSAAIWRRSTWSSEVCSRTSTLSKPWTFANWFGCALTTTGRARFQPRFAIRRRHEDHGIADRRRFWRPGRSRLVAAAPRGGALIDPVTPTVRNGAERGGARFQRGLAPHDLVELLVELFLIEQLAAGGAVDLGAQFGDAVFIGVLHLRLAGDQAGQNVVAKREIGRGRRRPHAEHGHRADHDPEHDRPEADLLAGVDEGVAVLPCGRGQTRPPPGARADALPWSCG